MSTRIPKRAETSLQLLGIALATVSRSALPEISRFYGIVIAMFYAEHGVPHFHAVYEGQKVSIGIENRAVLEGTLQPRALRLVLEWCRLPEGELLLN